MSVNQLYDRFNRIRSLLVPVVPVATPHIKKAYFAKKVITQVTREVNQEYVVTNGDTLGEIAWENGSNVQAIQSLNSLPSVDDIEVGQTIFIPQQVAIGEIVAFVRLTEGAIDSEAYLIVETQNFRQKTIKLNVKQGVEEILAPVDTTVEIEVEGERKAIIEVEVGAFVNDCEAHNSDDFLDFAIVKVKFSAADEETKNRWLQKIAESTDHYAQLSILVDAHTGNTDIPQSRFIYYGQNQGSDSMKNVWLDMERLWFRLVGLRSPWMEIVTQEAVAARGVRENSSPLRGMIENKYHDYVRMEEATHAAAWCASFACWALHEKGYSNPRSSGSRFFIDTEERHFQQVDEARYGAIAVWSDCNSSGRTRNSGHVSFVFGKFTDSDTTNIFLVLGGNQGDRLKVSRYDCTGDPFFSYRKSDGTRVYKKFRGFFMPLSYTPSSIDVMGESDTYATLSDANKAATDSEIGGGSGGETSR
jgi:uncharacterized protein (TIGR02594 family)